MINFILLQTTRIGAPILGIIIPALIFAISFLVTYFLIRHFMKNI
jgi:hypothetical protein